MDHKSKETEKIISKLDSTNIKDVFFSQGKITGIPINDFIKYSDENLSEQTISDLEKVIELELEKRKNLHISISYLKKSLKIYTDSFDEIINILKKNKMEECIDALQQAKYEAEIPMQ